METTQKDTLPASTKTAPFSSIVATTSSIGSKYGPSLLENLPKNPLIEQKQILEIADSFLQSSLKVAGFLDRNYDSFVNWAHHNFMYIPYENIISYLNGLKRLNSSKQNIYLRIVMRWLTLSLPNFQNPAEISGEEFIKKFSFDPNYGEEKFENSLKIFYQHAIENWKIEEDTGPMDTIKMALLITAKTIIDDLLEEQHETPGLAEAMVQALSEFEEKNKAFSTRKAFITSVAAKVDREKFDVETIETLILFHQVGLALYHLSSLSDMSFVKRFVIVAKKSVTRWTEKASNVAQCTYSVTLNGYNSVYSYTQFTCQSLGLDRICESIEEGKKQVVVQYHELEKSEHFQKVLAALAQYSQLLQSQGEELATFVMKNSGACLDFIKQRKETFIQFLNEKYTALDQEYEASQRLAKIAQQGQDFVADVHEAGKEMLSFAFQNFVQFLQTNRKQLMDLVVRVSEYEVEVNQERSVKLKDVTSDDVCSMLAYTMDLIEKRTQLISQLSKLNMFGDCCSMLKQGSSEEIASPIIADLESEE